MILQKKYAIVWSLVTYQKINDDEGSQKQMENIHG